jgi:hypothetical protein
MVALELQGYARRKSNANRCVRQAFSALTKTSSRGNVCRDEQVFPWEFDLTVVHDHRK